VHPLLYHLRPLPANVALSPRRQPAAYWHAPLPRPLSPVRNMPRWIVGGSFIVAGPADAVGIAGPAVATVLGGRGGGKSGRFQVRSPAFCQWRDACTVQCVYSESNSKCRGQQRAWMRKRLKRLPLPLSPLSPHPPLEGREGLFLRLVRTTYLLHMQPRRIIRIGDGDPQWPPVRQTPHRRRTRRSRRLDT
jgi:hypothetical protein